MASETFVPPELASSARVLLMAFMRWVGEAKQEQMLQSEDWSFPMMIDLFLMECGANGELARDGFDN